MNNSPTPRTDAATEAVWHGPQAGIMKHPSLGARIAVDEAEKTYMVSADFARQLERENAELREVMQELADCEMPEIVWFRKLQGRARDALEAKPHAQDSSDRTA